MWAHCSSNDVSKPKWRGSSPHGSLGQNWDGNMTGEGNHPKYGTNLGADQSQTWMAVWRVLLQVRCVFAEAHDSFLWLAVQWRHSEAAEVWTSLRQDSQRSAAKSGNPGVSPSIVLLLMTSVSATAFLCVSLRETLQICTTALLPQQHDPCPSGGSSSLFLTTPLPWRKARAGEAS